MMCFADKTFCGGDGCDKFETCPKALTNQIREHARLAHLEIAEYEQPKLLPCYISACELASKVNK